MARGWSSLIFIGLACASLGTPVARHVCLITFKTRPFIYSQDDVVRVLREGGIRVDVVDWVRRDAFGTKLVVFLFPDRTGRNRLVTITSNGLSSAIPPGRRAFADREGVWIAWSDDYKKGVHFKSGETLMLPAFALFDVDPSGKYFVVGEKPNSTWLGSTASPSQRALISDGVLGERVFTSNGKIYVCGNLYKRGSREDDPKAVCLIVQDDRGQFNIQSRKTFAWSSGIDEHPYSERLLLRNKSDLFPLVYLCDLSTDKEA